MQTFLRRGKVDGNLSSVLLSLSLPPPSLSLLPPTLSLPPPSHPPQVLWLSRGHSSGLHLVGFTSTISRVSGPKMPSLTAHMAEYKSTTVDTLKTLGPFASVSRGLVASQCEIT